MNNLEFCFSSGNVFFFQYVIMMSQAILVFNPYVGWASNLLRPQKQIVHIIMQIFGSTLAITGSILKITNREGSLTSAHGILGKFTKCFEIECLKSWISIVPS